MASLILRYPRTGLVIQIPPHGALIGKGTKCDIILDYDSVSRHHARVGWAPDGWFVEDHQSTGGTFVNDLPIGRWRLRDHDLVKLGIVVLEFLGEADQP